MHRRLAELQASRNAHRAVAEYYGARHFRTYLERLEFLFDLYRQYTDPLTQIAEKRCAKPNAAAARNRRHTET